MTQPADRPLTDRDYQALARLRSGLRRFLEFSESAARSAGVTPAQHQLLLAVRGHPSTEPPSVTDIAEVLRRRRHSIVELIDRAREHDLVRSEADPTDARRRLITLTPRGLEAIEHLSAVHRRELSGFRNDLNAILDDLD